MTLGMSFPFGREGRADDLSELWEKLSSTEQPHDVLIHRGSGGPGRGGKRENSQLAGRFRRWWQVLGSDQERLH
jgi:hypothetical protein